MGESHACDQPFPKYVRLTPVSTRVLKRIGESHTCDHPCFWEHGWKHNCDHPCSQKLGRKTHMWQPMFSKAYVRITPVTGGPSPSENSSSSTPGQQNASFYDLQCCKNRRSAPEKIWSAFGVPQGYAILLVCLPMPSPAIREMTFIAGRIDEVHLGKV